MKSYSIENIKIKLCYENVTRRLQIFYNYKKLLKKNNKQFKIIVIEITKANERKNKMQHKIIDKNVERVKRTLFVLQKINI